MPQNQINVVHSENCNAGDGKNGSKNKKKTLRAVVAEGTIRGRLGVVPGLSPGIEFFYPLVVICNRHSLTQDL